jgi:hypothetical protein
MRKGNDKFLKPGTIKGTPGTSKPIFGKPGEDKIKLILTPSITKLSKELTKQKKQAVDSRNLGGITAPKAVKNVNPTYRNGMY